MRIVVEKAGAQTLVVDRGRFGHRHEGVAWCAPADDLAYEIANALVRNPLDAAALEIMFGNVTIRFSDVRRIALTGAACEATLDGRRCGIWSVHTAQPGSVLQLKAVDRGVFAYVAIGGGVNVPMQLDSRTTDRFAAIGGFEGRALREGDTLPLGDAVQTVTMPFAIAPPDRREVIRMIPCAQWTQLDESSRDRIFGCTWRVASQSSRMGYRLLGAPLACAGPELASHAVFPGMMQVPPSGDPIVLLADAHTTGGYPVAGVVIEEDLRHVAQTRPGESLSFVETAMDEALEASRKRRDYVQTIVRLAAQREPA